MNDVYLLFLIHNYEWPLSTWIHLAGFGKFASSSLASTFIGESCLRSNAIFWNFFAFSKLSFRRNKEKTFSPLLPSSSLVFSLFHHHEIPFLCCLPRSYATLVEGSPKKTKILVGNFTVVCGTRGLWMAGEMGEKIIHEKISSWAGGEASSSQENQFWIHKPDNRRRYHSHELSWKLLCVASRENFCSSLSFLYSFVGFIAHIAKTDFFRPFCPSSLSLQTISLSLFFEFSNVTVHVRAITTSPQTFGFSEIWKILANHTHDTRRESWTMRMEFKSEHTKKPKNKVNAKA